MQSASDLALNGTYFGLECEWVKFSGAFGASPKSYMRPIDNC